MALFCESLNIRHSYLGIDDGNDGKVALFWINLTARIFTFATRFPKIESDVNVIITFAPGSADG
jgi:hypothetical protein